VLKRVFWCFPQCVAGFAHYRPIISVDETFLTGKYKGTLMIAVGITMKSHLLLLAFVLVEGENNESWSWFLTLVRKEVLGPGRSICIILNRHRGLLNGAKEPLEGYPPLIHMWCTHHFVTNIWKKQRSKEVIVRLKALRKIKEEKKFDTRLKDLEKILNNDGNAWLFEQFSEKSKCNEYFVSRWEKARNSLANGERWGKPGRKHVLEQNEISNNEVAAIFDPTKLVYMVKSSSWTNVGGDVS
jgi:hypothetical protein